MIKIILGIMILAVVVMVLIHLNNVHFCKDLDHKF